jgi:hypothetical protein
MYCPKCSQQQISDNVRFCSRCGFPLGRVVELLSVDEALAAREAGTLVKPSFREHKGTRMGAKLLFASMILVPIALALCFLVDSPVPLLIPLTVFLTGLAQVLYVRIFGESALPEKRGGAAELSNSKERRLDLPSARPAPMSLIDSQRINTGEIVQPPSVTERTTNLLNNK